MTVSEYIGSGIEEELYMGADIAYAGVFGVLAVFYVLIITFIVALSVATYVLHSLGLYTIARRRGIRKPWLAWIPIGNLWLLGSISDQYQYLVKGKVKTRRRMLVGLSITVVAVYFIWLFCMIMSIVMSQAGVPEVAGLVLLMFIGIFGIFAAAIALAVYRYMCYYDLYCSCERTNGVLYLILSILFSGIMPFLVFACRKKDEGMPPRRQPTPQPVQVVPEVTCEPAREEPQLTEEKEAEGGNPDEQTIPVADA